MTIRARLIAAAALVPLTGSARAAVNGYAQTNLVADNAGFHPQIVDPNLVDAWGIASARRGPAGTSGSPTP